MGQIILASASPRRKELLEQIGLEFEICPAKGEEVISKSAPEEVVMELSGQRRTTITTEELLRAFQQQGLDNDRILFSAE